MELGEAVPDLLSWVARPPPSVIMPLLDEPLGPDLADRFLALIVAYISGWVYAGSSASLWPKRR